MKQLLVIILCLFTCTDYIFAAPNPDLGKRERGSSTLIVDCAHAGDSMYTDTGGLAGLDTLTYLPLTSRGKQAIIHGLTIGQGSGIIRVTYEGGGKAAIPFFCDTLESKNIFWGERVISIDSGTTFTGKIWPKF